MFMLLLCSLCGCTSNTEQLPSTQDVRGGLDVAYDTQASDALGPSPDAVDDDDGRPTDALAPLRQSLVDNALWVEVLPDEDPFLAQAGDKPDYCPPTEYWSEEMPEGLVFEVNTTFCAYLTVRQGARISAAAGKSVDITVSHYEIVDGDGAYYLAIAIGSPPVVVWEKTVDVGVLESTYKESFSLPQDVASGEELLFHISNHGDNHWFLMDLSVAL